MSVKEAFLQLRSQHGQKIYCSNKEFADGAKVKNYLYSEEYKSHTYTNNNAF